MDKDINDYITWSRTNDGLSFEDWRRCRDLDEQSAGGQQLLLEDAEHESDEDDAIIAEEFVENYQRAPIVAMVKSICSDDHEGFESAFEEAMRRKTEVYTEHLRALLAQKLFNKNDDDDEGEDENE